MLELGRGGACQTSGPNVFETVTLPLSKPLVPADLRCSIAVHGRYVAGQDARGYPKLLRKPTAQQDCRLAVRALGGASAVNPHQQLLRLRSCVGLQPVDRDERGRPDAYRRPRRSFRR